MSDPFEEHLRGWQEYCATPWARIRYAVVAETLARNLSVLDGPLRVLDVGGGDGLDSLPLAEAGHDVTVLDTSPGMLAEARRTAEERGVAARLTTVEGSIELLPSFGADWDVVLCHFLLRYRPAGSGDVDLLARAVRPGGVLSVIDTNPAGGVLGRVARSGPAAALELLDAVSQHSVTFDHTTRTLTAREVRAELERAGCEVLAEYGGRIANDLVTDDAAKQDPVFFADLLRLELALCDREPYRRVGQFWQLVATRVRT